MTQHIGFVCSSDLKPRDMLNWRCYRIAPGGLKWQCIVIIENTWGHRQRHSHLSQSCRCCSWKDCHVSLCPKDHPSTRSWRKCLVGCNLSHRGWTAVVYASHVWWGFLKADKNKRLANAKRPCDCRPCAVPTSEKFTVQLCALYFRHDVIQLSWPRSWQCVPSALNVNVKKFKKRG